MRERLVLTLGCVAAAWALLAGATERPPVENREIRIFRVAGAMVETGDFLVPHARGQPRLHKPPLYYWLASGARLVTSLPPRVAYRFPSVLAGIGLIAAVYALRLATGAAGVALPAALALPSFGLLYGCAREANFDMLLAATAFSAAAAFWLWLARGSSGWWHVGVGAFAAAMLAKATPALGAVLVPVAIAALLHRPLRRRPWPAVLWAGLLAALPLAVWGAVALLASPESIHVVIDETLQPFGWQSPTTTASHYRNPFFYLYMIPLLTLPGSLLLPAVILRAIATKGYRQAPILRWALWSGLLILGVFSLVPQKQENYMAMVLPYEALLVGDALWAVARHVASRRCALTARAAAAVWSLIAIAAGGGLWWGLTRLVDVGALEAGIISAVPVALGALALWWAFAAWPWRPWLAGLGACVVLAGTVNGTLLALQAQIKSGEALRRGDPRVERWLALAARHNLKKAVFPSGDRDREPDER